MPTLTGLTLEQARAAAAKDHFTLHVDKGVQSITVGDRASSSRRAPKPGKVLKEGATLSVVPSLGPAVGGRAVAHRHDLRPGG